MAIDTPKRKADGGTPLPVRMQEADKPLTRAAKKSGLQKADIVRMAVVAFLEAHPTPEKLIEAAVRYRAAQRAA